MIERMLENSDVSDILQRALDGERLGLDDGIRLLQSKNLAAIGAVANIVRWRLNGSRSYYIVNRHINYTNVCKNKCRFCAFYKSPDDPTAIRMSISEVSDRAAQMYDQIKFTELHIVGGCDPDLPFDYYTNLLSSLKSRFPTVHLQAFTAVEIAHIAEAGRMTVKEALKILRESGLDSIPGGGAEVFSARVRSALCPSKLPPDKWLEVMREAHSLGIRSNATMLYGHIETDAERVEHLIKLRDLQDETHGFMAFIPLKFHIENTDINQGLRRQSSTDDLKLFAISRLILDNFPHIKAFWIMLGVKLAQIALSFGADDFDGTVVEEHITHSAGAKTPEYLTPQEIRDLISETGTVPVERDTLYNEVTRDETGMPALLKR